MIKNTSVIVNKIYPMVATSLDKNSNALKKCIGNFITRRHTELYDNAPYGPIYFGKTELDEFYNAIKIKESDVLNELQNAFFWGVAYNPPQIKEPFTVIMIMAIRYYLIKNKQKEAELCTIYLAFSGKFYSSVYGISFKKFAPKREVMEYVVNNKLSERFDLRKDGTVFGAIRSLSITWLETYKKLIKSKLDDDDCGTVIQQLRDREKSFIKNIASVYYEAYENKEYLNYESENLEDGDNFRMVTNDSLRADKYTEMASEYLISNTVDMKLCKMCSDQNIKALEIKDIIESIISNNDYILEIKEVLNILITDYQKNNLGKPLDSLDFITYSIRTKPNTKDKNVIRLKQIILGWLDENSPQYRKRKNRPATAISYYKAILQYFVLIINKVVR